MSSRTSKELANLRMEHSKDTLKAAKILYNADRFRGANDRAYYSIFHSIRAILALEAIDFKSQNEVVKYFDKHYIGSEFFSNTLGKRIMQAKRICEDSNYDDEFIVNPEVTKDQIATAEELINLVENYIESKT